MYFNHRSSSKSNSTFLDDYGAFIAIGVAVVAILGFFIISNSNNSEERKAATKEKYVASIAKWVEAYHPSMAATKRKEVAECVYEKDPDVLYLRNQLKAQEDKENENRMIVSSKYHGYGDFLKDLESYVNNGEGKILQEEKNRIDDAISKCTK